MRSKLDRTDPLACRIDNSQASISVTHPDVTAAPVVSDVVGIVTELSSLLQRQRGPVVDPELTVPSCSYVEPACLRVKESTLWFFETFDFRGSLTFLHIDNFDGTVTKSGNKQTLSGVIRLKMINSPFDAGQWDFLFQTQRIFSGTLERNAAKNHQAEGHSKQNKSIQHSYNKI